MSSSARIFLAVVTSILALGFGGGLMLAQSAIKQPSDYQIRAGSGQAPAVRVILPASSEPALQASRPFGPLRCKLSRRRTCLFHSKNRLKAPVTSRRRSPPKNDESAAGVMLDRNPRRWLRVRSNKRNKSGNVLSQASWHLVETIHVQGFLKL